MAGVLGLDIGGANLKAAHSAGPTQVTRFALWRHPEQLQDHLARLVHSMPPAPTLAITMTGEICDCYSSKREGVSQILNAVEAVADQRKVCVWLTDGRLVEVGLARQIPLLAAASNWHALATFLGRQVPHGTALLVDVGSTTSDVIPIREGKPVPRGHTDPERLQTQELVYTGITRTPLTTLMGKKGAAELFATTEDIYLLLHDLEERPEARDTADGRPATIAMAHGRIARMLCADLETSTAEQRLKLARQLAQEQVAILADAIKTVCEYQPSLPLEVILAGSGEFLAERAVLAALGSVPLVRLADQLGDGVSQAACAHAIALLTHERMMHA